MLKGDKVTLRPYIEKDIDVLFNIRNNLRIQDMLMVLPKPNTRQNVLEWVKNKENSENSIFFILSENISNNAIGFIQIVDIDFRNRHGCIGIAFDENFQGKGYFIEVMKLMESYAIKYYGLIKLIAYIFESNEKSIKAFEKLGYIKSGVLKKHFYQDKLFHNVCIYEKLLCKL